MLTAKRLLFIAAIIFIAASAQAQTLVHSTTCATSASPVSLTFTSTTAGNALFLFVFTAGGVSPTATNFVVDASEVSSMEGVFILSDLNNAGGITTVSIAASPDIILACGAEYSGINTSLAFDKTAASPNAGETGTYTSGATATTSQANELLLGMVGTGQSSTSAIAANGSWTNPVALIANGPDGDSARWQQQIVSATGTYAATGTVNSGLARVHSLIATYKATGGGGSPPPTPSNRKKQRIH